MNYTEFGQEFATKYKEFNSEYPDKIYLSDFMAFLSKNIKKEKREIEKDESEFFNGDSEISPNQYDFEYRQNWAIEESGKAYNPY